MPRALYFSRQFWTERHFKKELDRLGEQAREAVLRDITELLECLKDAGHPATDPRLKRWRPYPYRSVIDTGGKGLHLYEYHLRGLGRLVVVHYTAESRVGGDCIVVQFASLSHDHPRLQSLIRQSKREIYDWEPSGE